MTLCSPQNTFVDFVVICKLSYSGAASDCSNERTEASVS
jgi:hypothetical protein